MHFLNYSNTLTAVTFYISDILQGRKPFINSTTACTYPKPWIDNIPKSVPSDTKKIHIDVPPLSYTNHAKENKEKYIGNYGHRLFGNISVWYDEEKQSLIAKAGHIGYAELIPTIDESTFITNLIGPLEFIFRVKGGSNPMIPLIFQSESNGKYQEILNIWEPEDPPIYKRGLQWDD